MATDITKIKPQILIQDEGVDLTRRDIIDFVGAGVTATDDALNNKTIVTIPGGGAGATGIWGIADATGTYTFYANLGLAIAAAVSGDVIVLFTNYTETVSSSVFYKDGVNINLNGHTYEYAVADINDTLSDGGLAATVTIFNGTLKRTNSSAPTNTTGVCLKVSNASSNITLQGVTVIAEDGSNCCIVQGGKLSGGHFRQIGAVAGSTFAFFANSANSIIDNIHVHADSKYTRLDSGIISNSYFRNDSNFAIYVFSGEAYNITGYSTSLYGILTGANSKLFNSTGISTAERAINNGGEMHNCSGYSTAGSGIVGGNNSISINSSGTSTALYGIASTTSAEIYNCIGLSSAAASIQSGGRLVKTSAICTWNNAAGHGFIDIANNSEIIDCYAEVANASAYGVNAPTTSPYVTGFSGRGMTVLLNLLSNAQVNTTDSFGNILIG